MTDRRLTPANGRVAHSSLEGKVEAKRFTDGHLRQIGGTTAAIYDHHIDDPKCARDRELITGDYFTVLEYDDRCAFGISEKDGYVGYVPRHNLVLPDTPTHMVVAPRSYAKETPGLKSTAQTTQLSFGAKVTVTKDIDGWSEIIMLRTDERPEGHKFYVPTVHLRPLPATMSDSVDVAQLLMGTPYLWGGNSAFGIDCSGLVQMGCLACGINCPGDSDMQQADLGRLLSDDAELKRGDLLFWKGHVAWVSDPNTILHANAYHMAVAFEPLDEAIKRIADQGDGPVTARKRLGGTT
ncbi:Dipeptidyl-peptidase 6 [Roseovarius albus]|uniref:Dipeptidyl-peptidase 6 n=1 Tax=Roseovarius albus TaxID=1247867 RepID=A0A1X6YVH7_9RHOB|nr:NlpC/P60 family protein [Roseovarius albus]SLN31875.1 Dipeptidyl-peptidase 6 [Roseovarius albus]